MPWSQGKGGENQSCLDQSKTSEPLIQRRGTDILAGQHADFVTASLAPVLSDSFRLASASLWHQTSMYCVLDTHPQVYTPKRVLS